MPDELHLWFWMVPGLDGKRRKTTYRMTEDDARARYGDAAEKIESSLEVRRGAAPYTSDFLRAR